MSHQFIDRCYLVKDIVPLWGLISCIYGVVTVFWVMFLAKYPTFTVHKFLLLVPILEMLPPIVMARNFHLCPWTTNMEEWDEQKLVLAQQVIITFSQCFLISFIFMLCNGWSLTTNTFDQKSVVTLAAITGVLYSILYVTHENLGLQTAINVIMSGFWLIMGIANLRNLRTQLAVVE